MAGGAVFVYAETGLNRGRLGESGLFGCSLSAWAARCHPAVYWSDARVYPHHAESIRRVVEYFAKEPEAEALILGGSLAHGFAGPASDIDVMIVVSEAAYTRRIGAGQLTFFDRALCTYDGGYVDGKYVRLAFLRQAAEMGSDPARFAFLDAQVLFSRIDGLDEMLRAIARYPVAQKADRLRRFYAQFEAWNWYAHEALKLNNPYLLGVSVGRLVLFGGRLILTHNELLYPYHKWFLRVLERADDKPVDLLDRIARLYADSSGEAVTSFYEAVKNFRAWPALPAGWSSQFMIDSELNWLNGSVPVDDL